MSNPSLETQESSSPPPAPPPSGPPAPQGPGGSRSGRGPSAEMVAILVALIGLVGSITVLIVTDQLGERSREQVARKTAAQNLGRAVVEWEQTSATLAEEELISLLDQRAEYLSLPEPAGGLQTAYDAALGSVLRADAAFSGVRDARDGLYLIGRAEEVRSAQKLFEAARLRRLQLHYVFDMISNDPRDGLVDPNVVEEFRAQVDRRDRTRVFGDPAPDREPLVCPDGDVASGSIDNYRTAVLHAHDCLVETFNEYVRGLRTQVGG